MTNVQRKLIGYWDLIGIWYLLVIIGILYAGCDLIYLHRLYPSELRAGIKYNRRLFCAYMNSKIFTADIAIGTIDNFQIISKFPYRILYYLRRRIINAQGEFQRVLRHNRALFIKTEYISGSGLVTYLITMCFKMRSRIVVFLPLRTFLKITCQQKIQKYVRTRQHRRRLRSSSMQRKRSHRKIVK